MISRIRHCSPPRYWEFPLYPQGQPSLQISCLNDLAAVQPHHKGAPLSGRPSSQRTGRSGDASQVRSPPRWYRRSVRRLVRTFFATPRCPGAGYQQTIESVSSGQWEEQSARAGRVPVSSIALVHVIRQISADSFQFVGQDDSQFDKADLERRAGQS